MQHESLRVGEAAAVVPGAIRVFELLGIDCCGEPDDLLADALARTGRTVVDFADAARAASSLDPIPFEPWLTRPLGALTRHILTECHDRESHRLDAIVVDLARDGPRAHDDLRSAFTDLANNLAVHMWRERHEVFPLIERLEDVPPARDGPVPTPRNPSVENPLLADLRRVRRALEWAPADPALTREIRDFDRLLHRHIHLEDHVLYPRAWRLCPQVAGADDAAADLTWF